MTGTETVHQLWLDDEARIVSFRPMEDWRRLAFRDHGQFMCFLQDLQQKGYRFQ